MVIRIRRSLILLACLSFLAACGVSSVNPQNSRESPATQTPASPVTLAVSAASDLNLVFPEMAKRFEQTNGVKVVFNFGSTGQLAQQIERGAPVDLFASANRSYIEELEQKGLVISDTKQIYGRGRIVIWTRKDSPLKIQQLSDLTRPDVKRIAIANPDHAPYGIAAREALQTIGIWERVQPKLVLGENVRQTLQYAETGNVDVAIAALALSINSTGQWSLIPENLHNPLDQMLAVIQKAPHEAEARQFATFVNSEQGRTLMRQYGFVLPGEKLP